MTGPAARPAIAPPTAVRFQAPPAVADRPSLAVQFLAPATATTLVAPMASTSKYLLAPAASKLGIPAPVATLDPKPMGANAPSGQAKAYWGDIDALRGHDLLVAMRQRMQQTHHDLGYATARDMLFGPIAQAMDGAGVVDLYTGRVVPGIFDRKSAYAKGMNTEHTWPQSRGATGSVKSDLIHLEPSDITVNGRRGNFPYGEVERVVYQSDPVPGIEGVSKLGYDASGKMVFEPRAEAKRWVAEDAFGIFVQEGSNPSSSMFNDFRASYPVLKKWYDEGKVQNMRVRRNDAVEAAQGSRNPAIDFDITKVLDLDAEVNGRAGSRDARRGVAAFATAA